MNLEVYMQALACFSSLLSKVKPLVLTYLCVPVSPPINNFENISLIRYEHYVTKSHSPF